MHVWLLSTAVFLICYHVHTLQVSTLCYHSLACRYNIFTMYVPGKYTYCKIKCYRNMCDILLKLCVLEESECVSYPEACRMKNEDKKEQRGWCTFSILHEWFLIIININVTKFQGTFHDWLEREKLDLVSLPNIRGSMTSKSSSWKEHI